MLFSEKYRKFTEIQYYLFHSSNHGLYVQMKARNAKTLNKKSVIFWKNIYILIIGKFDEFFWHKDRIQREILLRKSYFKYIFRAYGYQNVKVRAKNSKTAEYLKWKINWEIEKFNFLKNLNIGDFVFCADHYLVVHRRHSHKNIRSIF